jgi:hypothetical protein
MKPLDDANSIKINKLALEVISSHGKVFFKQIQNDSINLFDDIFLLCNHKNHELKMAANEAIEKISIHISDCLIEGNDIHKDAFKYLIIKIKNVLETKTAVMLTNTAISLIGIFANAIIRFMGENILEKYLEELIVLSDQDILHALGKEAYKSKTIEEMTNSYKERKDDLAKPSKSIKYVLAIQKQYISLLNSYSNIIGNLTHINELIVNHFYKILLVGFSTHQKFYEKYKVRLTDSIAHIIVNMFNHKNFFWSFLRKIIKNGFIESIKLTTNMLFKENIDTSSIQMSVVFWINLFNKEKIFTEFTVAKVFDQLMSEINELFSSLNLNYKEVNDSNMDSNINSQQDNSISISQINVNEVYYEAEDMNDLEICNRIISFLKEFLKKFTIHKLFKPWILVLLKKLMQLGNEHPRVSAIYEGLSSIMRYCHKVNFFSFMNEETKSFLNELETFNKNLIKKIEIFQDDLLLKTLEFLLSLPSQLIKIIYSRDIDNLRYVFKKAFQIGYNDIRYAKLALNALRNWLEEDSGNVNSMINVSSTLNYGNNESLTVLNSSSLTKSKNVLIRDILPIFGDYLLEYQKIKESLDPTDVETIEKYNKIQNKIFKILGEIGGEAHSIVKSNESQDTLTLEEKSCSNRILNVLNKKSLDYPLPLYNKKYPIYFDHLIIKIGEYASTSFMKDKKFAAAELLHSLILYIIGSETKRSIDITQNTDLLVYLMDKMLNLSCDLEKAVSVIYETLLFQTIHWMAKKGSTNDNKGIIAMLDVIIENTSSRKNLKLREISSQCISEYIKWFIKQHSDQTIKENSATIKYIIRRVESNCQHPDAFKRLGALLCFEKIVSIIGLNDALVDKFCIEILYYLISMLKISHNWSELSEIIFSHVLTTVNILLKIFSKKFYIVSKTNPKRNFFKDIFELWNFLYEKFTVIENECRYICQLLWVRIFDMIKVEIGFENPKQYFYVNKNFPQLNEISEDENINNCGLEIVNSNVSLSKIDKLLINYEVLYFCLSNKIFDFNDITIYYQKFSLENNLEDLKMILNLMNEGREIISNINNVKNEGALPISDEINFENFKSILLSFIFIVELMTNSNNISYAHKIIGLLLYKEKEKHSNQIVEDEYSNINININLNENKTFLNTLLQTIESFFGKNSTSKNFRKFDVKCFIYDSYENVYTKFIMAYEKLMRLVIESCICSDIDNLSILSKIETYFQENVLIFKDFSLRENLEELLESSINEKAVEFYFNLLFGGKLNDLKNNSQNSHESLKPIFKIKNGKLNLKTLLTCNNPKFQPLIKNYFKYLFYQDFIFITEVILETQYNFDLLADHFFSLLNNYSDSNPDPIVEELIKGCCINSERIFLLFILTERSTISKSNLCAVIAKIFTSSNRIENFSRISNDAIINQIKIANLILFNFIEGNVKFKKEDIESLSVLIDMYIQESSINVIKEIVNFLGLLVKLIGSCDLIKNVSEDKSLYDYLKKKNEGIKIYYQKIQSKFFPIKTHYLKPNTKEFNDFQLIYSSFLNTLKTVKSFEFLELLFPIIREEKTEYCKKVKNVLKEYVDEVLGHQNKNNLYVLNEIQKVIHIFLNKEIDRNLRDNIRFTLMKILGFKFLNKCDIEILKEIFIQNFRTFEGIIKQNIMDITISYENKYLIVLEKSVVYKFLEICFKRLPSEMVKDEITKRLFNSNAQGNELTKILILELHNAKRTKIPDFDLITKNIKLEELDEAYNNKVENRFYCNAYCSLAALIKCTQTKDDVFVKFLFQTIRDKNEKLFELLILKEFTYNFTVETNFYTKEVNKEIKNKSLEGSGNNQQKKLLIDEIITDSFFHDAYGKTLKETLVMEQKTLNLERPKELSKMLIENLEGFNKKYSGEGENKKISKTIIEEDKVNKHPVMETMLIILDHLYKKNLALNSYTSAMPPYIQEILSELKREDCSLNMKIFFIKIIINKPEIFEPYLQQFLLPLIKYSCDKNNGGKGFHYFLRDVATLIISNKNLKCEFNRENVEAMSNYINCLLKVSGDTKNIIFRTNLRIVSELMEKFKNVIYIQKKTILDMMKMEDNKPGSHIWKIVAVQALASAMEYNIPIGDEELYSNSNSGNNFKFIISLEKNEDVFPLLFKLCESTRTPVQSATIEFLAKIMQIYSSSSQYKNSQNKYFTIIYDHMEGLCVSKTEKYSINTIFRTSLHFITFLYKKRIFNKSLNLFKNANQNNRNLLLHTYNNLIEFLSDKLEEKSPNKMMVDDSSFGNRISNKNLIDDIYYNIYEMIEIIFVDPNDELIINLTIFIQNILKIKEEKYKEGISIIINRLQRDIRRKEESTRYVYYNFLMTIYENADKYNVNYSEFRKEILNFIILNLDKEPQHEMKKDIIAFLNKSETMPSDPVDRLLFILGNLTVENVEEKLIQIITKLLLILTANSADYSLKIYEKALSECDYRELNVNTVGYYINRSQPVAPSMAIRSSMDEAYETVVNISQKDVATQLGYLRSTQEMIATYLNTQAQDKVPNISSGVSNEISTNSNSINGNRNMPYNSNGSKVGNVPVPEVKNFSQSISHSQQEMMLSQYTSLISSNTNYITKNFSNKNVSTGLKLTSSPLESSFKEPLPIKKKARGLGKFLQDNEMHYTPVDQGKDNKIRFVPDGSYKDNRKQKEEYKDVLIRKWLRRQTDVRRTGVKLMRQYRSGDLPDILIYNKDIIDPLILLCDFNLDISSELFLEIMNSVYIESLSSNKQERLYKLIEKLLKDFKISNFLIISCLQRFMLNMMTVSDDYIPDLYLIKKTGLFTKNYHSSILLFEEYILNHSNKVLSVSEKQPLPSQKKMLEDDWEETVYNINSGESTTSLSNKDILVSTNNKQAWVNLLNFYSKIKMKDFELGLIQNFSDYRDLFIRNKSDFLNVLAELLTKSKNHIERNVDISKLLKSTFNIYDNSKSESSSLQSNKNQNKVLLNKYDASLFIDVDLKETIEEYSIKYCSDLGEWDNLSQYLNKNETLLLDEEIHRENPEKIESMLKSWVYTEDSLNKFNDLVEYGFASAKNNKENFLKIFLEETFTHHMSLFSIIQKDYDRALLYLEKSKQNFYKNWLNLGIHSSNLKHELIHKIQKINEVSEFLDFVRGTSSTNSNISLGNNMNINLTPEGSKNIINLFEKWLSRWPNYIYDDPLTFEEIYSQRKVFYEAFKNKFYNFEHIISDNPVLDTFFPRSHTAISTLMLKKDFLDLAEIHTGKALKLRKDNSISNSFIILPVLKNKYKILEIQSGNKENIVQFSQTVDKYEKLIKVLNDQIKNVNLDFETKEKLNILRIKLYLNQSLNTLEDQISKGSFITSGEKYNLLMKKSLSYFEEEVESYEKRMLDVNEDFPKNYVKLLRPMVKFSEKVLRKINDGDTKNYEDFIQQVSNLYLENSLKGLVMGDRKVINTIPKILDMLSKNPENLSDIFMKYSSKVSTNFYLKWKNQLIAYINSPISNYITPIIRKILDLNPQSLFFPFSVIEKYSDILMDHSTKSDLFYEIKNFYGTFTALNSFVEALDGMTHPEHRLKYWLDQLKETVNNYVSNQTDNEENFKQTLNKISLILGVIDYDVLECNKYYVGKKIGSYNLKFSKDIEKIIKPCLNIENFTILLKKRPADIIKEFAKMIEEISNNLNKTLNSNQVDGIERLSTFSEWLAQYECSEFTNPKKYIELPKDISSEVALDGKSVQISSFDQHVLILCSIRRPKRLTIYGNDEKSYSFLVKGGEDIRLDQRIMEVFKAFNEIMSKDSNCTKKNLKLTNFEVYPMSLKLGMIQWVADTTPLKNVIKFSMTKLFNDPNWDMKSCPAQHSRLKYLQSIAPDKSIIDQHYLALHVTNTRQMVNEFSKAENLFPKTVLKKALEHYLLTPEEILTTRINFMRNYSALCIACYILGIGDRHLENFLINTKNSQILAIDFGVAFGQGVTQTIPELVPFRLTNQLRNVIYPFGKKGVIRQTMIDTLSAFKNCKDYIQDYCEVFVKEPLLDWIKLSKSKSSEAQGLNGHGLSNSERNTTSAFNNPDISWLPIKKLNVIENKLNGVNPVHIITEEFMEAKHSNEKTYIIVKNHLQGDPESLRYKLKDDKHLEVEEQVDCLIEGASDRNLLGRMWIGWASFI